MPLEAPADDAAAGPADTGGLPRVPCPTKTNTPCRCIAVHHAGAVAVVAAPTANADAADAAASAAIGLDAATGNCCPAEV